jgi:hypothetical protein
MGRLESRFVRALVETLQQETSGSALTRLRHGLPPHWLRVLSRDVFGRVEQDAALDLQTGIDLLLAIERVLSGGSGKLMVRAAAALASRILYRSPVLVVPGDFVRTLQHLRGAFEHPFLDADVRFSVQGSSLGFVLEAELRGMPSAARWLAWIGLGYAESAASFSGHDPAQFRFEAQISADLARVTGRRTNTGLIELPRASAGVPASAPGRSPPARRRTPPTNAAARVDQILSRAALASRDPGGNADHSSRKPVSTSPESSPPARSGTRPAVQSVLPLRRKRVL